MHAVIVAGPSGAGKSSFLAELQASRLDEKIRRHLPVGMEAWPHFDSCLPRQWKPLLADTDLSSRTTGIVVHYDMTWHWQRLKQDFSQDPLWQLVHGCESVTLVLIQPSPSRLLKQWSRVQLNMHPWAVHARRLVTRLAAALLAAIRRLRRKHPRRPRHVRYPRPVRFLKHVDYSLRGYCRWSSGNFDFYRNGRNVETMMQSWDAVVAAQTAALPVVCVRLVPDPTTRIGRTFGWRIKAIETKAAAPEAQKLLLAG